MAEQNNMTTYQKFLVLYKWLLIALSVIGPIGSLIAIKRIDFSLIEGLVLIWATYPMLKAIDKIERGEDARFSFKGWTFEFTQPKKKNKDKETTGMLEGD